MNHLVPLLSLTALLVNAHSQTWAVYEPIVRSGMFPQAPVIINTPTETRRPPPPRKNWTIDYQLVLAHKDDQQVTVGLRERKTGRSFLIRHGETVNGIQFVRTRREKGKRVYDFAKQAKVETLSFSPTTTR